MRSASELTPASGRFLLDTNIVIALLENIAKVERFAAGRAIGSCDLDVARASRE